MLVVDIADLYMDQEEEMKIWDNETSRIVFRGTFSEAIDSEFAERDVVALEIKDGMLVISI